MNEQPVETASAEEGCDQAGAGRKSLPPRVSRWCAMLLDLSRRNRLLSFRDGPGAVRIAYPDPAAFEDAVAGGRALRIAGR
ncbi:MAG: DUF4011 domain-containing protein, partial [Kiritimatiellae bacterium]|nr:DUF4011 domain-containing protein [Kiritimatiellia bacterium]